MLDKIVWNILNNVRYIIKMITLILSPIIECKNIESDADCRKYALCGWKDWKENCALFCGECGMYLINSVQVF